MDKDKAINNARVTEIAEWLATKPLINSEEAADFLGVHKNTMANMRYKKIGPPYIEVNRSIKYDVRDLVQWIKQNKVIPTRPVKTD